MEQVRASVHVQVHVHVDVMAKHYSYLFVTPTDQQPIPSLLGWAPSPSDTIIFTSRGETEAGSPVAGLSQTPTCETP